MKNFDKFWGSANSQRKIIIFMLWTATGDLDYALEVLLQEVIFLIIKDLFNPKKPNSTCWMEELLMTEELY